MSRQQLSALMAVAFIGLFLASIFSAATVTAAERDDAIAAAKRKYEIAELRLRQFERAEYPLALRRIENELKITEAERDVQQRRIKEYGENSVFKYSEAFRVTLQEAKLAALRAELKIDELKNERLVLEQTREDRCRLLQLEIDAAANEVRALERRR